MQRESSPRADLSGLAARAAVVLLAAGNLGCPGKPGAATGPVAIRQPYAGIALRVVCPDPAVATALGLQATGWAGRSGAAVTVVGGRPAGDPAADVVVIPPGELGAWAARDDARPVPPELRAEENPLRWPRILTAYRERLAAWGREPRAVPLAGDGYVLAYRADRFAAHQVGFRQKTGRPLEPPTTWEGLAEVAEYVAAADGKPSLPPLPADPAGLLREFDFVAACYDRPALTETALREREGGALGEISLGALSFYYDATTGRPRLTAPGFAEAAKWLHRVNGLRMTGAADPVAALDRGTAVIAILTLAELGRLPKDGDTLSARFGIAPLPGTRSYLDPKTGAAQPPPDRVKGVNFVPYFGSGGWLGVVRQKCGAPEAAFELLADLAGPTRSLDLLSDPALGFGPFRAEQLEEQREAVWQRYGLDPAGTGKLVGALRQYTALTLANPAFAYRGPDQADVAAILDREVRRAATGQAAPADALKAAQEAWLKLDAARPPAEVAGWRRKAAGLE